MSKLTVELPESLQRSIAALAEKEGYSVDQFIATAAAEKMAALRTVDYLRQEAANSRREDFDRFLAAVPDAMPVETDRLQE
jgi:Arc/MetJ-type ribon-helix-helix transcriptional regulator